MKYLIILIILSLGIQNIYAKDIQFTDYPAKVYNGQPAKLLLNNETAKLFKTRLSEALKQKPVYAGEYVLTGWGCGLQCISYIFVNKRTGQVIEHDFGGETGEDILQYKLNSNLLITNATEFDEDYNEIGSATKYYVMKNSKLMLIKSVPNK